MADLEMRTFWHRLLLLSALLVPCLSCRPLALSFAPEKTPLYQDTPLTKQATDRFWETFHGDRYEDHAQAIRMLTAAYLENPRNPKVSLLLAMAHYWVIVERNRAPEKDPQVTDHAILAERYLEETYRLNPGDGRLLGFLGGIKLALGHIHQDQKLTREGYFYIQDGIRTYPEFNYFVESYLFSRLPKSDPHFASAVDAVWKNVEVCAGDHMKVRNSEEAQRVTKNFLAAADSLSTDKRRACLNSWIAPHNFEGFCMHWGDVLVKNGDEHEAKAIYNFAKLSADYPQWKYRHLLEARIQNVEKNALLFDDPDASKHPELMVNSAYACVGCHAQ